MRYVYLKTDIKKYFASIDHSILLKIIQRKIKDKQILNLVKIIVRHNITTQKEIIIGVSEGKGLPIGNLTSQFFANVYLDQLDHYLKDFLGVKNYLRYMDDLVIFATNKDDLKELREIIGSFLTSNLALKMKESATFINQRINGLSFLGCRVFPDLLRLKRENLKRSLRGLKKREKEYEQGKISEEKYCRSVNSIISHLGNFNTLCLRKSIF